jgi:hypothetical protein
MLREKAAAGQLIAFNWATAKFGDKEPRLAQEGKLKKVAPVRR